MKPPPLFRTGRAALPFGFSSVSARNNTFFALNASIHFKRGCPLNAKQAQVARGRWHKNVKKTSQKRPLKILQLERKIEIKPRFLRQRQTISIVLRCKSIAFARPKQLFYRIIAMLLHGKRAAFRPFFRSFGGLLINKNLVISYKQLIIRDLLCLC